MTTTAMQCSEESRKLFVSLELNKKTWIVSFAVSVSSGIRRRSVVGGCLEALLLEIALAKRALKLPEDPNVIACYEARRDGFGYSGHYSRPGSSVAHRKRCRWNWIVGQSEPRRIGWPTSVWCER